ncbi:YtxH domain-containing protein [Paenibacillus arenosi]|uniref:YtxH domain-containing protein n=1 Tax=Paenibacillus arenosi TaxID=2774142 RepID=A0ABR9AXH3_9BACL|nr:YtxH domain-containing protein [Paenibacillus arenosi]MBD8498596.1 YtxH domain-containing protein [Paenibacillus arenosi]
MAKGTKPFWIGAIIGTVVGSVSALLFAPKSGRELREDIAEGAKQIGERTQTIAKQVGESTNEFIEASKNRIGEVKQSISEWKQSRLQVSSVVEEISDNKEADESPCGEEVCESDSACESQ